MDLAQIAILLREIVDICPSLDGSTVTLLPQKAKPSFRGYHIKIKAPFLKESIGCLRKIAEGHDLVLEIKTDFIIIYETRGFR
jgi:hypothetical protein